MKSKLNKFILKIVLFFSPLLAFCIAVYVAFAKFPMYFFDGEYAMFKQQKDYIFNNDDYNRVIITGDSKPKAAYIPALLSDDTYNISLGGLTPLENYYYLKEYLEKRQVPETVFIAFSPYHFMCIDTFWERSVYFHSLSNEDLKEIYKTALRYEGQDNDPIYKWTEDILTDFDDKILEYKVYSVKQYGKAFIKSLTENRYEVNSEEYDLATGANGQTYFGKLKYSEEIGVESRYLSFRPLGIMDYYLRKTFDMCLDLGVDVILEVVPMNKATYDACYESFLTDYFDYMKGLQSEYPQITINGDLYYYDNEYFGDTNHLNPNGAEKYSNSIKEKYPDVFE